jgi:hypothetical protein
MEREEVAQLCAQQKLGSAEEALGGVHLRGATLRMILPFGPTGCC